MENNNKNQKSHMIIYTTEKSVKRWGINLWIPMIISGFQPIHGILRKEVRKNGLL